jgi:imidazolonepropionase
MNDPTVIPDGALLIVDGVVREVGPTRRVEMLQAARDAIEIDATGKVVMPGFVDCYTHLVCAQPRFVSANPLPSNHEDARLPETVRSLRASTGQRMEFEARRRLRHFVRQGTTTLDARTGYGLDDSTELKTLRVLCGLQNRPLNIVPSFFGARAVPPEFEGRPGDYLAWVAEHILPLVKRRKLAHVVCIRCGPGAFGGEPAENFAARAVELGFAVRVETVPKDPSESLDLARRWNALSLDGLEACSKDQIEALAGAGFPLTLLPGRVFHQGRCDYPPARALIDAGAAVALATGFDAETSSTSSMPMILGLATRYLGMTAAEAIVAGTINAAWALGVQNQAGSIEYGKPADLLMMNVSDYREIPHYFGMNLLAMAMRRGEMLYPRMEST